MEEVKVFTTEEKKQSLESAIYYLMVQQPFYGTMFQCLTVNFNNLVPTAGITYDKKNDQFKVLINPNFFCAMPLNQRIAVLHHEVLHFTNKHLFRLPFLEEATKPEERQLFNIAGDMAINQYIQNLPEGCIDVKAWKTKDGKAFPTFRAMEEYYQLIKDNQECNQQNMKGDGDGKGGQKVLDEHFWDALSEEEKEKMLQEAKKLIKRTLEKTVYSSSDMPDSIKDLLDELDCLTTKMNYKALLKQAIKKTVCMTDREGTWNRRNKRFGVYAPGTKNGNVPRCNFYVDTSGSISTTEMNEFLGIMSKFLKAGSRTCTLGLWHTNLYYRKNYKLKSPVPGDEVEAGGTDVTCVLQDIKKSNPNLSIILTDMYFDMPKIKIDSQVIWIVSKGGNTNFKPPFGKVIYLDYLKD